jgi:hypothetical protein
MSKQHSIAVALAVVALALGIAPVSALAQPAAAQAETLFRQGKDLLGKGQVAEACAAFDASQKLAPTVTTLLNQASCREKNGQLATAWGLFIEAERETRAAAADSTRQLHQVAVNHAAKLEPRLSTLTITVAPENRVGGLQVLRNAEPVDPGAWNKALPIDGGTYKITASAPGNADWSSMITIGNERDAKTIEIPKLKAAALQPSRVAPSPTSPHPTSESADKPEPTPARSRSLVAPLAFGGAAVALVGGAVGFELSARSLNDQSLAATDNARRQSLHQSANSRRYIGEGLGVASVVCAGVAAWLYLRSTGDEPTAHVARVQVTPLIDGDRAGVLVMGRY